VKVLEIATLGAAPLSIRLLSDFGAEVVKVEDPTTGDPARAITPLKDGISINFERLNTNKKSVAISLRSPQGVAAIKRLIPYFDVVVENFRPGRIAKWGLDYDSLAAINPRIIMMHMSGFGQTGPRREEPGFGGIAEAISGYTYVTRWPGDRPSASPFMLGDSTAAFGAALAINQALYRREKTGKGSELDCTLFEPLLKMMGDVVARYTALGTVPQPTGSLSFGGSPRGAFECADGMWITLSAVQQNIAIRLFEIMGQPELIQDPRFATNADRVAHNTEINDIVAQWVSKYPRDEVFDLLHAGQVPVGKLYTGKDIAEDQHFAERGSIVEMESSHLPGMKVPGLPYRISGFDGIPYREAPLLGEHTDEVLLEIAGLSAGEIGELRQAGVINPAPGELVPSAKGAAGTEES
jgi:crotonobetainyl-CoA:carnitine CoA-transferase CaiB-like acyl-CoA transferase